MMDRRQEHAKLDTSAAYHCIHRKKIKKKGIVAVLEVGMATKEVSSKTVVKETKGIAERHGPQFIPKLRKVTLGEVSTTNCQKRILEA
jgi:hypothetical protein